MIWKLLAWALVVLVLGETLLVAVWSVWRAWRIWRAERSLVGRTLVVGGHRYTITRVKDWNTLTLDRPFERQPDSADQFIVR